MQTLFINPAWDAAGCSYKQAEAINLHTTWKARHFRAVHTYYEDHDIVPENYDKDEFIEIIKQSDVLHFCSAIHSYESTHDFGFNWTDHIQGKVLIFHDYNSFMGKWSERSTEKDLWNKRKEIGYNAIFSSIPQANRIYEGCVYIPDTVNELSDLYTPLPIDRSKLILGHFPTGNEVVRNNKNTDDLLEALELMKVCDRINIDNEITAGLFHKELMAVKKRCTFGFDALWRGFHGMTTVENLALGIPTMVGIDGNFEQVFKEFHSTDVFPFEPVSNVVTIIKTIKKYYNDPALLVARQKEVRQFMVDKWSYKNIANRIIKEYEKI